MISANLEASNKEDWIIQFSATDAETGDDIIWTGASIDFRLKDASGCTLIDASTTAGTITIVDPTVVEITIDEDTMGSLCAGPYQIGCIYELNSITAQAFVGTASIYDGVASL